MEKQRESMKPKIGYLKRASKSTYPNWKIRSKSVSIHRQHFLTYKKKSLNAPPSKNYG